MATIDRDETFTRVVQPTIRDARAGVVDPSRLFAPNRARLTVFLQSMAPRILGPMGNWPESVSWPNARLTASDTATTR
jgi:hypothetical protein